MALHSSSGAPTTSSLISDPQTPVKCKLKIAIDQFPGEAEDWVAIRGKLLHFLKGGGMKGGEGLGKSQV